MGVLRLLPPQSASAFVTTKTQSPRNLRPVNYTQAHWSLSSILGLDTAQYSYSSNLLF